MPSPKKPKKKSPADEKQKSLFSFVEKPETEIKEGDKSISKDEKKEIEEPVKTHKQPETKKIKKRSKLELQKCIILKVTENHLD